MGVAKVKFFDLLACCTPSLAGIVGQLQTYRAAFPPAPDMVRDLSSRLEAAIASLSKFELRNQVLAFVSAAIEHNEAAKAVPYVPCPIGDGEGGDFDIFGDLEREMSEEHDFTGALLRIASRLWLTLPEREQQRLCAMFDQVTMRHHADAPGRDDPRRDSGHASEAIPPAVDGDGGDAGPAVS
jgi:hypothetical protein